MGKHGNNDNGRKEKKGKYEAKHAYPLPSASCRHENTVYIAGEFHCNSCGETVG